MRERRGNMKHSKIMFENLRAEMARKNITITEIAKTIGVNRDTLGKKFSGKSSLNLDEAFLIQKKFFPEMEVQLLFQELNENPKKAG